MPGGELKLQFDDGCEFDEGARTLDELARLAAARVLHPEIRYEFGADGRLRPLGAAPTSRLARARPARTAARGLHPGVRAQDPGARAGRGVHRRDRPRRPGFAAGLPPTGRLSGCGSSRAPLPRSGPAVFGEERDAAALVQADGSFVTSYGLTLPAGRCSVAVSVLDPESGRSAVATADVEAPDYAGKALVVSPLVVLSGDTGDAGRAPGSDPYAAFAIGAERFQPRAGNVLGQSRLAAPAGARPQRHARAGDRAGVAEGVLQRAPGRQGGGERQGPGVRHCRLPRPRSGRSAWRPLRRAATWRRWRSPTR